MFTRSSLVGGLVETSVGVADYLELSWPWLRRRCGEVTGHGLANLVAPRGRLLRLDGVERACRYIGGLPNRDGG